MEPDDLLCSRNARPQKALVGRAQWKISQPHPLRDNERAWRDHLYRSHNARSKGQPQPLPLRKSIRSRKALATGKERLSARPGWVGEKARARMG